MKLVSLEGLGNANTPKDAEELDENGKKIEKKGEVGFPPPPQGFTRIMMACNPLKPHYTCVNDLG